MVPRRRPTAPKIAAAGIDAAGWDGAGYSLRAPPKGPSYELATSWICATGQLRMSYLALSDQRGIKLPFDLMYASRLSG